MFPATGVVRAHGVGHARSEAGLFAGSSSVMNVIAIPPLVLATVAVITEEPMVVVTLSVPRRYRRLRGAYEARLASWHEHDLLRRYFRIDVAAVKV